MLGARMFGGLNVILMIFKALDAPSALQRFILPPAFALMPLTFIGPWTRDPLFRQRLKPFIGPCIFPPAPETVYWTMDQKDR